MVKIIDKHTIESTLNHGHDHNRIHEKMKDKVLNFDYNMTVPGMESAEVRLETYFIMGKCNGGNLLSLRQCSVKMNQTFVMSSWYSYVDIRLYFAVSRTVCEKFCLSGFY